MISIHQYINTYMLYAMSYENTRNPEDTFSREIEGGRLWPGGVFGGFDLGAKTGGSAQKCPLNRLSPIRQCQGVGINRTGVLQSI